MIQKKSIKFSPTKKADRCFYIRFFRNNKCYNKKVGWASEGYTPKIVANMKSELIEKWLSEDNEEQDKPKVSTFNDLFEIFIEWAKQNKKSWQRDNGLYHNYIKSFLGDKKIEEIKPADINNMLLVIKSKGKVKNGEPLAPQSIKYVLVI